MESHKKIKILFAIGRLSVGGAEKLLVHQLRVINKDKFNPYLVTLFLEQKDSFEKEIVMNKNNWQRFDFQSLVDFRSWIKLLWFLRKEKFDSVVTSLFSANFIVRLAAILIRVPVIISYEHNLYPNKRRWQIWADRWLAGYTDKILVDAKSVKEFTARQEDINLEKFSVLYHPPLIFDPPAISRNDLYKKFNLPSDAKIILTVSRLVEEKGHQYLIEAAAKVIEKYPNAYFLLVGWGPLEESLKSKVKSQKLEKNVILTGRLDIKDILPYAEIYVEPALTVDIGIASLEALQAGKPIVSSRVGEMPVFIKEGQNGFLVKPGDVKELAEKIIQLLENEKLRLDFGRESRKIIAPYSLGSYMQTFESLVIKLHKEKY